jgi:hypothetical protein
MLRFVAVPQKPISPLLSLCIHVYLYTQGRGEELNQRKGERGNTGEYRSQRWVENINVNA